MLRINRKVIGVLCSVVIFLSACLPSQPAPAVDTTLPVSQENSPTKIIPTTITIDLTESTVNPASSTSADKINNAVSAFLEDLDDYHAIGLAAFREALLSDPPPFLLDVREVDEVVQNGHIEGAVIIPIHDLARQTDLLPSFDTPILTYCGSGWRCTIAVTVLGILGWQDVRCLKENSFGGWVKAGYPVATGLPDQALTLKIAQPDPDLLSAVDEMLRSLPNNFGGISQADLMAGLTDNPELTLIDVRTEEEIAASGSIKTKNVISIPLEALITRKAELPVDKSEPMVIYCSDGHRSTMAMTLLRLEGYTNVWSLRGGFEDWVKAGLPVKEAAAP